MMNDSIWREWIEKEKMITDQKLPQSKKADVCIIGAGIVGVTCAYELSKLGYNISVIEKETIGSGTTGYTTGKITSQHGMFYDYLTNSFGSNFAKKYLEANEKAIQEIENRIKNENIDCDFEKKESYVYVTKKEEIPLLQKEFSVVQSLGYPCEYAENIDLPFQVAGAIVFPNQAQFHPLKYLMGLYKKSKEYSCEFYTNVVAMDIQKDGEYKKVITNKGEIEAKYVIVASHYPFIKIEGFYFTKMYQSSSYILAIKTKKELPKGMYITATAPNISFRTARYQGEDILLLAGGDHKTGQPITYQNTYGELEKLARKYYPDSQMIKKWSTEDCISLDKIPYIGELSTFSNNIFVATGFKKWGMTLSNVAANIIIDKIKGEENEYCELFQSTRMQPIKNYKEMKNVIVDSTN